MPGLLLQAANSLDIDLKRSIMIGDAWTDLQAAQAAGVSRYAMVLTGRGRQQLTEPKPLEVSLAPIFPDLASALTNLLAKK